MTTPTILILAGKRDGRLDPLAEKAGVSHKAVVPIRGKPLIQWSIEAARAATELDRCIVSTDDEEIADMARSLGADVPFLRPAEFAQDNTPDLPVFQHAIRWLGEHEGYRPDIILHLRPTLPFREPRQIDDVIRLLREATRERQLTVVMVTHDPRAAAVGDRIVRLADGAIVGDEPVSEQAV